LEFLSGTEDNLSSPTLRDGSDIVTEDQFNAPRLEFLVDEFPERIRELVVQQQVPSMNNYDFLVLDVVISFPHRMKWKVGVCTG
jgi:hypothetical protein